MRIYNTWSRGKEDLVPLTPGEVRMYVCGVTVYDLSHIGHARSGVVFDVIRRYLHFAGYRVRVVKNYTDVDDKIIRRAQQDGVSWSDVSERNIAEYRRDMDALGVRPADVEPKATDHIPQMIDLIARLIAGGFAYAVDGDVYFEIARFPAYGRLSGKNLEDLVAGARVDVDERKRDPRDFALWKASKPGEPSWPSPWGAGRPGWHIECSAMAIAYLGESFDVHGGGEDLIFPHHECEIAQSEAVTGKTFARYWVHNGFVNLGAEKMSKSLGNVLNIRSLLERHQPDALRLFLLGTHYRNGVEFAEARVAEAATALQRLRNVVQFGIFRAHDAGVPFDDPADGWASQAKVEALLSVLSDETLRRDLSELVGRFVAAMDDDLNTPEALGALFNLVPVLTAQSHLVDELIGREGLGERSRPALADLVRSTSVFRQLGRALGLFEGRFTPDEAPADVTRLAAERAEARKQRDWKRADALRDEIHRLGWTVEDTPAGPRMSRRAT
jgi:cysteinyl-tRNA synthetase